MRAVRQTEFGGPEVLKLVTVEDPKPLGTEILVRVKAIGINPVEAAIRAGHYPMLGPPPFILGWDVSGVVEAVNSVSRFAVGDEVFGMPLFPRAASGYAELVAGPARQFAKKPARWSHEQAAAGALAGLTAWQALIDGAAIQPGERVLIHGAGGGVGHLAVQLAKARGAHVVATASAAKLGFVRGLGADQVIDYGAQRFEDVAGPVDVVFETISAENGLRSLPLLNPGGRLATIAEGHNVAFMEAVRQRGMQFIPILVEPDYVALGAMAALGEAGRLAPHVAARFPLAEAGAAHIALATKPAGKLVLIP